jgi:ADP-ribosylglycohydrolase
MAFSTLPSDYAERVYAGVLGKIIGVYLGRPFEGWSHDDVLAKLGEVDYYVHERLNAPLVVTDDDISGTFTFLRALEDHGFDPGLTAKQIGDTWLNYLIENRTVLWWGGLGNSTEHTAYLRLKHGITAPASGSIATNGQVVAEQIGAQIFIDGWGLIHPNDPEQAAYWARSAGSVSHDGAALDGAVIVAALVASAFGEASISEMLDLSLAQISPDGVIARLIADVREWHAAGLDWKDGFQKIKAQYGYDRYGGGCHMVPNHALIIHALLHGEDYFQRALMIANTCGWDTDCNSGNVGAILGVRLGLQGIDAGPDWRGPVADRILLPTADGGRTVTDALTETYHVIETAIRLRGQDCVAPKGGARFHFSLPGSVQGFDGPVSNYDGRLRIASEDTARTLTRTWVTPEDLKMQGYGLYASPTLYPGQTLTATVASDRDVAVRLVIERYDETDSLITVLGPTVSLTAEEATAIDWLVPDTEGYPIARVGLEIEGTAYVDLHQFHWHGTPKVRFSKPAGGKAFRKSWTNAADDFPDWGSDFRVVQNEGTGLVTTGTREWSDYTVSAVIEANLAAQFGLVARHQGMRRYYALVLDRTFGLQLIRQLNEVTVLDSKPFEVKFNRSYQFELTVSGASIVGKLDGEVVLSAVDDTFVSGGIGLLVTEGRIDATSIEVR